jgi:hypothetical protein
LKRAPIRAWLVTGPVGRFVGFALDFLKAMWTLWKSRRQQ